MHDGERRDVNVEMDASELNAFIASMQAAQAEMDAGRRGDDDAATLP